jgi:hypothetical protein
MFKPPVLSQLTSFTMLYTTWVTFEWFLTWHLNHMPLLQMCHIDTIVRFGYIDSGVSVEKATVVNRSFTKRDIKRIYEVNCTERC